jgi:hypothetical protein
MPFSHHNCAMRVLVSAVVLDPIIALPTAKLWASKMPLPDLKSRHPRQRSAAYGNDPDAAVLDQPQRQLTGADLPRLFVAGRVAHDP